MQVPEHPYLVAFPAVRCLGLNAAGRGRGQQVEHLAQGHTLPLVHGLMGKRREAGPTTLKCLKLISRGGVGDGTPQKGRERTVCIKTTLHVNRQCLPLLTDCAPRHDISKALKVPTLPGTEASKSPTPQVS